MSDLTAAPTAPTAPTGQGRATRDRGELFTLSAGPYRAEISAVGAVLESLTIDDRDLLVRNPLDGPMLFYRGAIVAPWPNRIGDGRYTWDGTEYQTPITEVERGNALHGLVSFQAFTALALTEDQVTLRTELFPTTGYPFHLELTVQYELDAQRGLRTRVRTRNIGSQDAPYGVCPHPYLIAGPEPLDTWQLRFEAATLLTVTEDRLLPTGTEAVTAGHRYDFSEPRVIGGLFIDHAFTDLGRDKDDLLHVTVSAPGGTGVRLSAGPECGWLQVHTGDRPEPEHNRLGLAVEPMTCPPDAFRSGTDVVRLSPGADHQASWTISGW